MIFPVDPASPPMHHPTSSAGGSLPILTPPHNGVGRRAGMGVKRLKPNQKLEYSTSLHHDGILEYFIYHDLFWEITTSLHHDVILGSFISLSFSGK